VCDIIFLQKHHEEDSKFPVAGPMQVSVQSSLKSNTVGPQCCCSTNWNVPASGVEVSTHSLDGTYACASTTLIVVIIIQVINS